MKLVFELAVTSFTDSHSFFLPMWLGLLTRHAGFMGNELVNLSNELASAVERVAGGVVAVFARPHIGSIEAKRQQTALQPDGH